MNHVDILLFYCCLVYCLNSIVYLLLISNLVFLLPRVEAY